MRKFLREYYAEMVLSRSMTITARVIEACWKIYKYPDLRLEKLKKDPDGTERILVGDVTAVANQIIDEMNGRDSEDDDGKKKRDELSPQKIGRVIREELQLKVSERTNKGYYMFWDAIRMSALAKRYGVNPEEIGKVTETKPAGKPAEQGKIEF
jgi:hypothetical protein